MNVYNKHTINKAMRMLDEGKTLSEISAEIGCARQTIVNWKTARSNEPTPATTSDVTESDTRKRIADVASDMIKRGDYENAYKILNILL